MIDAPVFRSTNFEDGFPLAREGGADMSGSAVTPVGANVGLRVCDVSGARRGGPDTSFQLIHSGSPPPRYVRLSTMPDPEVAGSADSGKVTVVAVMPGADLMASRLKSAGRIDDARDPWDGKDT